MASSQEQSVERQPTPSQPQEDLVQGVLTKSPTIKSADRSPTPGSTSSQSLLPIAEASADATTHSGSEGATSRHTPLGSPPRAASADHAQAGTPQMTTDDGSAHQHVHDASDVPIDPALLDQPEAPLPASLQVIDSAATHQGDPALVGTSPLTSHVVSAVESDRVSPVSLLASPPGEVHNQIQPVQPDQPGPAKTPWALLTELKETSTDSQPASTTFTSDSPATPGLGLEGLNHGRPWADSSREGSSADFDSYVAATRGTSMTAASSESGFDGLDKVDTGAERGSDRLGGAGAGVPLPRPKKSHARKQPEGHIKRARNAFILFRKHITDSNLIPPSVEVKHQNISVVAAKMWREAPQDVRQKFQEQARIEKEEHQRKYPEYRYQPVFRRTDIIRRRVRNDPAEDEKVEAVAEALIKGKVKDELEHEIKEQMVALAEEDRAGASSDAESRASGPALTSRRRRRETGQLSKGALRAQRAQARAKEMRHNLIGSNLLSVSMYNAAEQRAASAAAAAVAGAGVGHGQPGAAGYTVFPAPGLAGPGVSMPSHPGAQHYQYALGGDQYMPMGYDLDRSMSYDASTMYDQSTTAMDHHHLHHLPLPLGATSMGMGMSGTGMPTGMGMDTGEMYRLPPIDSLSQGYDAGWPALGADYWGGGGDYIAGGEDMGDQGQGYYGDHGQAGQMAYEGYQLAPLLDLTEGSPDHSQADARHPAHGTDHDMDAHAGQGQGRLQARREDSHGADRGLWSHSHDAVDGDAGRQEQQQTPSGHVVFTERLFDGALGSAGIHLAGGGGEDVGGSAMDAAAATLGVGMDLGPGELRDGDGRDEGMSGFEEAMAQVSELSHW